MLFAAQNDTETGKPKTEDQVWNQLRIVFYDGSTDQYVPAQPCED